MRTCVCVCAFPHYVCYPFAAGTEVNPNGNYLETCQLLVQYGIALESADQSHGRTAAHWAIYYHRDDILAELVIAGKLVYTK